MSPHLALHLLCDVSHAAAAVGHLLPSLQEYHNICTRGHQELPPDSRQGLKDAVKTSSQSSKMC